MLLGSRAELLTLHESFRLFLASDNRTGSFPAVTTGSPAPYDRLLLGLRVQKCDEATRMYVSSDQWLELSGPPEILAQFGDKLPVQEDGRHHHWYSAPVSLIIEADDDWESAGVA